MFPNSDFNYFLRFFIFIGFWAILLPNPSFAHVVPEDQLRNKVYLTKTQSLKSAFKGSKKILHGKRPITKPQLQKIVQRLHQSIHRNYVDFFSAQFPNNQKYTALFEKASANSHPSTLCKLMVLFDPQGAVSLIKILEYKGPQRAEITSESFLSQFIGKTSDYDFSKTTSNEGKTQTVKAIRDAIRRSAVLFDVILKGN